ncbi:hypothetical protein [Klebsiella pneumoniae]|uniref:hypothetical protein n=1 Tax=Klebsiella pneumoniae TaxID=573 RepID=UPI0008090AEC|nr:hypothetical protein [Klebsiella pneumoniae]SBZ64587.1 Uncharacterised protein [Klebsiella pneumoniae]
MNVHKVYDTINHYHLDWLTPAGDYPKSALMVVECKDGRWMIVQEFGEEYGCFEGVLMNDSDLHTKPSFYPDFRSAVKSAFGMMKRLYPQYNDKPFSDFLSEITE